MNKDKFVERVVGILSDRLEEGLVKARNKAAKKSWEAEQGKKKFAAKVGVTPREQQAAQMGGKGGGAEALRRGVQASYRATHREDEAKDPATRGAIMTRVARGKLTGNPASTEANIKNDAEFYGKAMGDKRRERLAQVARRKDEASNDPRSEFIGSIVNNLTEKMQKAYDPKEARARRAASQERAKAAFGAMTGGGPKAESPADKLKTPDSLKKKEEASNDPKVNFINRTVDSLVERLIGKQKKIDVNKNGKLDAQDFKMLRKGKGK